MPEREELGLVEVSCIFIKYQKKNLKFLIWTRVQLLVYITVKFASL